MLEDKEKKRRKTSIIVHVVEESKATDPEQRIRGISRKQKT